MSGAEFLLDFNAVRLFVDDKKFAPTFLTPYSIIIIYHQSVGVFMQPRTNQQKQIFFDEFIEFVEVHPKSGDNNTLLVPVASTRKKYMLPLPDAIIAATAIINNARLLSAEQIF